MASVQLFKDIEETPFRTKRPHRKGLKIVEKQSRPESESPDSSQSLVECEASQTSDLRDPCGVLDTELAKHYFMHTAHTFATSGACEEHSDVWRVFIPAVALVCPVVRQGMLTLAAMSLHYDPAVHSSVDYLEVAEAHGKIFVRESRQKLQHFAESPKAQDQDTVLACSRLLSVLGFAFFRAHRQNGITLADPAAWTWLHLVRGVKPSYDAANEIGKSIDEIILKDMAPKSLDWLSSHDPAIRQQSYYHYIQQTSQERFDALHNLLDGHWSRFEEDKIEDLGAAIDMLDEVTQRVYTPQVHSLFRVLCTWPGAVPKNFVEMLLAGFLPALAVYAHWLMLVVLVEDLWWVGDWGRAGIRDVVAMCSEAEPDVQKLLMWPERMLSTMG
ncbi:uncharacterized protein KY384_004619 [Bacidia gigantensis]|uniref:uncharacterized protein n=1 Tax=Bacidia gigantensis TaxID=2732470 RepID=UPI001D0476E1|nr:uncharacterized protein KY384_004619 [Bacidia gigantensis]KAG8531261.1 hypothetical protein KY384_004619 [Bacidia gigantensis]